MSKECIGIFERMFEGEPPANVVYRNNKYGLLVAQDPSPVIEGHLVIASQKCAPTIDKLDLETSLRLWTVARYSGLVLELAFPDAPYIGGLIAGNQIAHPHLHRNPGDLDADWAKVFGKATVRPEILDERQAEIHHALTTGPAQELWEECDDVLWSMS